MIGILPAAGSGTRLRLRSPKELLPVAFFTDPLTGEVRPMLAAEHSLHAMREAGVRKCVLVINDQKPEMLRYFGNGTDTGLNIAYVVQPEQLGLASAVDAAFEWTADSNVCLALPDSVFTPRNALSTLGEALVERNADLVLGVFPTGSPRQLGPVRVGPDGRVIEVLEKPADTDLHNTWGVAAWTPKFSSFLHEANVRNVSIGVVFNDAVRQGLKVSAVTFEPGSYVDLGTGENIAAMLVGASCEGISQQKTLVSRTVG